MGFTRHKLILLLSFGIVSLYAVWLYAPTVRLPLIYDSLLHIRIANSLNWGNVWLPNSSFGFFRPMTFVPLLLIQQLFGTYPAWLLHGLNVAQHLLNVLLLIWLVQRLLDSWTHGFVAGLLFAAFPFSYQAVTVYGHNVHPAVTNLFLLGLHGYLSSIRQKRSYYWLLTTFCFLFALITHESAILFGPFAALLQWTQRENRPKSWAEFLQVWKQPWFYFTVAGLIYLGIYQFLPISQDPQAESVATGTVQVRVLYLLQAAVYPLAWLGNWVGLNTAVTLWLSLFIYIGLLIWRFWQDSQRFLLLFGLGWWGLGYLLIGIPLSVDYLLRGPRLLYLGGVGVCLLWTIIFLGADRQSSPKVDWRLGISVGVITAVLFTNTQFLRQKVATYANLTAPVDLMMDTVANDSESGGVIFLNLPQWINTQQADYPVGVELVSMMGGYLFIEELVDFNVAKPLNAQATFIAEQFNEAGYTVGIHEQTAVQSLDLALPDHQHLFLTTYPETGPETRYLGFLAEDSAPAIATFGPYTLMDSKANYCSDTLTLSLNLHHDSAMVSSTMTMLVQALGADGQLVAQADGPPFGLRADLLNTTRPYTDIRTLTLKQPATTVLVGVYDFTTGEREPAEDSEKRPLADNVFRVVVEQDCDGD